MWHEIAPSCSAEEWAELPGPRQAYYVPNAQGRWVLDDLLGHIKSVQTPQTLLPAYQIRQYSHRRAAFLKREQLPPQTSSPTSRAIPAPGRNMSAGQTRTPARRTALRHGRPAGRRSSGSSGAAERLRSRGQRRQIHLRQRSSGPTAARVRPLPASSRLPSRRTAAVSTASILATISSVGMCRPKHKQLARQLLAYRRAALEPHQQAGLELGAGAARARPRRVVDQLPRSRRPPPASARRSSGSVPA